MSQNTLHIRYQLLHVPQQGAFIRESVYQQQMFAGPPNISCWWTPWLWHLAGETFSSWHLIWSVFCDMLCWIVISGFCLFYKYRILRINLWGFEYRDLIGHFIMRDKFRQMLYTNILPMAALELQNSLCAVNNEESCVCWWLSVRQSV